jgi:hypothetical protein
MKLPTWVQKFVPTYEAAFHIYELGMKYLGTKLGTHPGLKIPTTSTGKMY